MAAIVAGVPGSTASLAIEGASGSLPLDPRPSPLAPPSRDPDATLAPVDGTIAFHGLLAPLERLPRGVAAVAEDGPGLMSTMPKGREMFWAWDFERRAYYRLEAVLGYAGSQVWVYAEADQDADPARVSALGMALDERIIPRLRHAFGSDPLPGIDGVGPVTVLLLDIRDGYYYGTAPYVSGFFLPVNEYAQADLDRTMPGQRSNEREMVYVDLNPTDLGGPIVAQTAAHEFEHLIAWNHDRDEEPWLDEGLADLAVTVAGLGYPREHVAAFLRQPTTPLTQWSSEPADYGASYLFFLYLAEQRGSGDYRWLRDLVADEGDGMVAVGRALPAGHTLAEFFLDFALALVHDDVNTGGGRFGFASLDFGGPTGHLPAPAFIRHRIPSLTRATMPPWSLRTDGFTPGAGGLVIEVSSHPPACMGASVSAAAPSSHPPIDVTIRCGRTGRPAALSFPPASGGAKLLVQAVLANAADTPLSIAVSAPGAAGARWSRPVYLPLAITDSEPGRQDP